MNLNYARWLWVVVALQVSFLIGWAGYHETVRRTAPTIRLQTRPVDPRDILRGDYMVLNYDISRAATSGVEAGNVVVMLKPEGAFHVVAEVRSAPPPADDKQLWVHATARGSGSDMRLDYGIEQFFVPEGKGTPTFKTLEVEASLSATHRLYIKQLWLDGKRFP
jgi:uncharacterized membrane-anchored protein